jgi:hypothetical protein
MAPSPEQAKGWLGVILPLVQQAGPIFSLALLIALALSLWWLTGWLHGCVEHNRLLTERLLAQQQAFTQEIRLALAHCQPQRKD